MKRSLPLYVGVLVFAFSARPSVAQQARVLTFESVVELASAQNPDVLLARARVTQAEGALTTARVRLPANPEVDVFLGSRDTSLGGRSFEQEYSFLQRFEIGGQRGHRVAAASAMVGQRTFDVAAASLQAQTVALAAFYRAVHAQEIRRVAEEALGLAEEAVRAAQARYDAGETAILDVNVARVELARGRREQLAAASRLEGTLGELREVLALPPLEALRLEAPGQTAAVPPVDVLLSRLPERADIQALRASLTQAEAELRLTRATRTPDLFGGIGFRREEGEPVTGARFGFTLPLFQRQTGAISAAAARITETKIALDARHVAAEARLRAAHARYTTAVQAAEAITSSAVPLLEENESLTRESYQAGKIGLLELLVIRREGFAARREALDAQLEAVLAAVEVRGIAGVIR
jgi:cobalt-zinc-cadmium efflux system outer membrane protein